MRPPAPHVRRQAIDLARRAQASEGDNGWHVAAFDGDPSSPRDLLRFWRWTVADEQFYSFFPPGFVLNGPGDTGNLMRVFIGCDPLPPRDGYAARPTRRGYFAGEFPVSDIAIVVEPAERQMSLLGAE
jgi:hypothetical protein